MSMKIFSSLLQGKHQLKEESTMTITIFTLYLKQKQNNRQYIGQNICYDEETFFALINNAYQLKNINILVIVEQLIEQSICYNRI
ncbi:unnamed protein product [Rotaria socialis]